MLRRSLPLVLLLPVLVLVWLNLRWFQAEQLAGSVEAQLQRWSESPGTPLTRGDWELARDRISQALRHNPGRGEYWIMSAQVHLWRPQVSVLPAGREPASLNGLLELWPQLEAEDAENARSHEQAMADLRQSTRVRPTWSHGWLIWAGQKASNQELDAEFTLALQQGQLHGRHIPESQAFALQLALDHRFTVLADPTLRALALDNLQTVLAPDSRAAPRALAMLQDNAALADFCPLLQLDRVIDAARSSCAQ